MSSSKEKGYTPCQLCEDETLILTLPWGLPVKNNGVTKLIYIAIKIKPSLINDCFL